FRQVTIEDLNGDGNLDLTGNADFDTQVFLGNGSGSFTLAGTFQSGEKLAVGDLDGDHADDLAAVRDQGFVVLLNQRNPCHYGGDPSVDQNHNGIPDCIDPSVNNITIRFNSAIGKGSGTVSWETTFEADYLGFNIVTFDARGNRVQLNPVTIPC